MVGNDKFMAVVLFWNKALVAETIIQPSQSHLAKTGQGRRRLPVCDRMDSEPKTAPNVFHAEPFFHFGINFQIAPPKTLDTASNR
jgi:hypothetical protein